MINPSELIEKYSSISDEVEISPRKNIVDWNINSTVTFLDKNTLQLYIADYDSVSN